MSAPGVHALPAPQSVALAYTPAAVRNPLLALLNFDLHLGRLVARTSEPVLGQVRLAWWREELAKPVRERASGDPGLAALGEWWSGEEQALVALLDGWERLIGEAPLPREEIAAFAAGRGAGFAAFARIAGAGTWSDGAELAGRRWALADLAERTRDMRERDCCRSLFADGGRPSRLSRKLRGLAVLEGLATRAIARRDPLMAGRGGALAALRLGLVGR